MGRRVPGSRDAVHRVVETHDPVDPHEDSRRRRYGSQAKGIRVPYEGGVVSVTI